MDEKLIEDGWRSDDRRVAIKTVNNKIVSTVRLRTDHGFGGTPLWYETMIFPNENDLSEIYCERYTTKEQALEGHERAIKWAEENN